MMFVQRIRTWLLLAMVALVGCGGGGMDLPTATAPKLAEVKRIRSGFEVGAESTQAPAASSASPTGYATIRGTFKLEGDPPPLPLLAVDKDTNVCAPGGKPVYDQDFVFDPSTKGIANVVVFLEKCPDEWIHESAKPGNSDEIVFDQKQCVFLTRMVAMQTSQKLRALNSDPVGHNLKVATFNQTIPSGGFAIYQPLKESRAPEEMACSIHPWMKAWMLTRDNGYFAVSKPDGTFEIPNVPAGVKLDFRVWQERSKAVTQATVNGEDTKWSKGRMTVTLDPDQDLNLDVVLNASLFN